MTHKSIKALLSNAINHVASAISSYVINPGRDLIRNKKLRATTLISFIVSCGSSSTELELLDFFGINSNASSSSPLINHVQN